MSQMHPTDLDKMLRNLIANPDRLNEVKSKLQSGVETAEPKSRWSSAAQDDIDDMFDNLPV